MKSRHYVMEGAAKEGLSRFFDEREEQYKAAGGIALELGYEGGGFYSTSGFDGTHVVGFEAVNPLPTGLRVSRSKGTAGLAVPDIKTPDGKAIAKKMQAVVIPNLWTLGGYLGIGNDMIIGERGRTTPGLEHHKLGEVDVIVVSDLDDERLAKRVPEGARLISHADFLRMQADHEDAQSAGA